MGTRCLTDGSNFEIVVADDGSSDRTNEVLELARDSLGLTIRHIWHEDRGFRKCEILYRAIKASEGEYLIFTDGDCVPKADFIAIHRELLSPGCFLSGGYIKLPLDLSKAISKDDVKSGRAFDYKWLRERGMPSTHKTRKLKADGLRAILFNFITPTTPSWNGHNASAFKSDLVKINGFDERMEWGGEDRELGERLENLGIKGRQIRFLAHCVHLDHGRPYVNQEKLKLNNQIRRETAATSSVWTDYGIVKPS